MKKPLGFVASRYSNCGTAVADRKGSTDRYGIARHHHLEDGLNDEIRPVEVNPMTAFRSDHLFYIAADPADFFVAEGRRLSRREHEHGNVPDGFCAAHFAHGGRNSFDMAAHPFVEVSSRPMRSDAWA